METEVISSFGPAVYGAELHIDGAVFWNCKIGVPTIVDVETDEKDNFVGLALCQDSKHIYYSTILSEVATLLENCPLIGHNVKFDLKQLVNWGVNIKPEQMFYDTCLASYVQNTTKESHGLKDLSKEYLNMEWPTYKDMVGTGKKKVTLDKQEIGRVAAYCGMDCLATYKLYEYFQKNLNPQQKRYLEIIELPTARALMEMELKGVQVDLDFLTTLNQDFSFQLDCISNEIDTYAAEAGFLRHWSETEGEWIFKENCKCCGNGDMEFVPNGKITQHVEPFNINSNRQVAQLLQVQGAILPKTPKGALKVDKKTLEQWQHLPAVSLLLEYSKIEKLKSTYTESLLEKQKNGRVHCQFNQISKDVKGNTFGISTGRLSSSNPNLQNIPARTEEGKSIRRAFIPGTDNLFIDADFSQIEPRLVAHFSQDPLFIRAFKEDRDIYQDLVEGTGRERNDGKTFMLALLYGAQPKKLASIFKCSEEEANNICNSIMRKIPGVRAWIERTKFTAKKKSGVWTLFKRWIPLPNINSLDRYEKMHWERVAVNSVIQGSAAEIMKLTLMKLKESGYSSVLTVHDEYLIEIYNDLRLSNPMEVAMLDIKNIMENIVKLDVPLKASIGIGKSWGEAKA